MMISWCANDKPAIGNAWLRITARSKGFKIGMDEDAQSKSFTSIGMDAKSSVVRLTRARFEWADISKD